MKRKASSVPAQASSPRSHIPKQRRSDLGAVRGGKETAADMDEESDEEMMDLDDLQAFSIRDRWDDADIGSGEQPLTGGAPAATAARAAATIAAFATAAAATTRTAGTANAAAAAAAATAADAAAAPPPPPPQNNGAAAMQRPGFRPGQRHRHRHGGDGIPGVRRRPPSPPGPSSALGATVQRVRDQRGGEQVMRFSKSGLNPRRPSLRLPSSQQI
ncbi:hypothetical protein CYMTET_41462 [Cymbomonas tetramitiformis]|uniref:Uncharacterized protein n=1 Tax=Cymbomonas tetramitiformis TaxID=36881 RepID=A0AAE0C738_9CHLO|nr:hypothetical protein CYMTET_41462 [Cymbomonas tetramitiformis]